MEVVGVKFEDTSLLLAGEFSSEEEKLVTVFWAGIHYLEQKRTGEKFVLSNPLIHDIRACPRCGVDYSVKARGEYIEVSRGKYKLICLDDKQLQLADALTFAVLGMNYDKVLSNVTKILEEVK